MSQPTYRERTVGFRNLRNAYINAAHTHSTDKSNVDTSLLSSSVNANIVVNIPPVWIRIVEEIDINMSKIEEQIGSLKHYHSLRQRVMFDDDKCDEYDMQIQEITKYITSLFKASKVKLHEMAMNGDESSLNILDKTVRYNAMRSRATKLQELTKIFRNAQRYFLQQIQREEYIAHKYIDIESVTQTLPDLSDIYDENFNQEQIQKIQEMERDASKKTQEILNIAKSVHELAELFNDLSTLVIEQGSVLDRIDYHVEKTLHILETTVPVIQRTNKIQKRSKAALCIIVLIVLIVLMGIILLLRHI